MNSVRALQKLEVCSLLAVLLIISASIPMAPSARAQTTNAQPRSNETVDKKIKRVESGLLPPAVIRGEALLLMKLEDRMRFHKTPGLSVAVINDGRIEWARSYGVTEAGGSKRVSVDTMFQGASLSKPVVAMAALRLVQQGKISLDEDVNRKLISWKVPENEFTKDQKVTLRRLLSHTAGINVPGFLGYTVDEKQPNLLQILEGQQPAKSAPIRVEMTPGTKFSYSGGGYIVLQQLMSDVARSPFAQLMDRQLLRRLGMAHSTFEQPLAPETAAFAASGHLPDGNTIPARWYVYPEVAPAGLWSTPSDLARFVIEIQNSYHGRANKILSKKMVDQMLTPQAENSSLGLFVEGRDRSARFFFSGSNVGFKCYLVGYLNAGQGAVVMANSETSAPLVFEVLRSIASAYDWPDYHPRERVIAVIDPSVYDAYVGEYEIVPGFVLTVTKEGNKLMSEARGQPRSEMFPESETAFFVKDADAQFTFVRDDKGNVVQVNIRRTTREFKAKKIK